MLGKLGSAVGVSHKHDRTCESHSHSHGSIEPTILRSQRGLWAVKWSFVGFILTAILQAGVFFISGSVALLADTIHNVGDAVTAIPLGVAFWLARWQPNQRFSYGYGRVEDLAGVVLVGIILLSGIITGYESIDRFIHPQPMEHLGAVAVAGAIGFIGNEIVARFRIKVGEEINSAALIADGYHARVDSLTSLAVLFSALGLWLGYPLVDPIIGFLITVAIFHLVWESSQSIFTRLLDGVEPEVIETMRHGIHHVPEVMAIESIRARWSGHQLYAELAVAVEPTISVAKSSDIVAAVKEELFEHVPYLTEAMVRVVPAKIDNG